MFTNWAYLIFDQFKFGQFGNCPFCFLTSLDFDQSGFNHFGFNQFWFQPVLISTSLVSTTWEKRLAHKSTLIESTKEAQPICISCAVLVIHRLSEHKQQHQKVQQQHQQLQQHKEVDEKWTDGQQKITPPPTTWSMNTICNSSNYINNPRSKQTTINFQQ